MDNYKQCEPENAHLKGRTRMLYGRNIQYIVAIAIVVNMFANRYRIYLIQLSCSDNQAREELGGGRDVACFNQDYLDTEFDLVMCDPPNKFYIYGKCLHEIKIRNTAAKSNEKVRDLILSQG